MRSQVTFSTAHSLTHLLTYLLTDRLTHSLTRFTSIVIFNFVVRKSVANSSSNASAVQSANTITDDDFEDGTEDEEDLVLSELKMGNDLSLAYRNIRYLLPSLSTIHLLTRQFRTIPLSIAKDQDIGTIIKLDLTECLIKRLENLKYFQSLECLVLTHSLALSILGYSIYF